MFRVDKNANKTEYTNKTFRLPADLVERLHLIAQREDVSLNTLVIQCCQYALDNLVQETDDSNRT